MNKKFLFGLRLERFHKIFFACLVVTIICNAYFVYFAYLREESTASIPSVFDKNLSPEEFLVWSENCRIPPLEIFSQRIKKFYKPHKTLKCKRKEPLVWKTFHSKLGQYRLNIDRKRTKAKFFKCCYKKILQHANYPDKFFYSQCKNFENYTLMPKPIKFGIIGNCSAPLHKKPIYLDAFFFFTPEETPANNSKITIDEKLNVSSNGFGIILIGLDSSSQFNFRRTMPRTFKFLDRNAWFELSGYNKMAYNSFPNIMALLAGLNQSASHHYCRPYEGGRLDDCPFLFEKFRNHGFLTAYAEDQTHLGTFKYGMHGFSKPPTDIFMVPWLSAFEEDIEYREQNSMYCIGDKIAASMIYDAATEFLLSSSKKPKFGFYWTNSISHEHFDVPSSYDEHMLHFMEQWQSYGFFEKHVFIFFSDHGMRFGVLREQPDGFYEERLPVMFIWLPPHIRAKYPEFENALNINKHRLSSPFDIHITLQHLLQLSVIESGNNLNASPPITPAESCPTCHSVLKPIKENRTCSEAGIPSHWCSCEPYVAVDINVKFMLRIMELVVNKINNFILMHSSTLCERLQLTRYYDVNVKSKNFDVEEKDYQNLNLELLDPESTGITFRASFETIPKHAEYEASFVYFRKSHEIDLDVNEISLETKYNNISWCTNDPILKRFCVCS